jgi:EAL domain-containing protein (putative c-di-GMP-specific phosphodiesterase class I)
MPESETAAVLLVDDDPCVLITFAEALRDVGYRVVTAATGLEALLLIETGVYDAILSDIQMPGMNGIDLVKAVGARELDTPVLLMTGNPALETAVGAVEHGALRYLLKPVSLEQLIAAVDEGVRRCRRSRTQRRAFDHMAAWHSAASDALAATLERAIGSLWMAYQPIVRAGDGTPFGSEALVRSSESALPHPGALFETAERLGRVPELGRAVRRAVAAEAAAGDGVTFVNLHSLELNDASLFRRDEPFSRRAGSTVLEITERASLAGISDTRHRVAVLRSLGFRIAVDDLGAGYAGLNSFTALEPDVVKLDMALVRDVDRSRVKRRLIGSMVSVCKEMGILIVAEGVETNAERQTLVDLGCDLLQGFLIGRPAKRSAVA